MHDSRGRTTNDLNPLRSLRERNAKIFFGGLWISGIGTWAHNTAVVLLIRELGGGGVELGVAAACQFAPMLFLGLYAGAIADRVDRLRLTMRLQTLMGLVAVGLGLATVTGAVTIPLVYLFTLAFGILSAFDNPTRRSFATELVPTENLGNVLSLSTSAMTGARIFGPAIAAVLAAATGTGWVFLLNGVTYLAFLVAMARIDQSRLHRVAPAPRTATPIRDGLRAVWSIPDLRLALIVFAVISTFAYNHMVGLPLLVTDRLDADPRLFGWLLSAMSVGNVIGALIVARNERTPITWVFGSGFALGVVLGILALTTSVPPAFVLVFLFGVAAIGFANSSTNLVQERVSPQMRSRALALTTVLFIGSTPIGGPITGVIGDAFGAVWANLYGAVISVVAATVGWIAYRRRAESKPSPATSTMTGSCS